MCIRDRSYREWPQYHPGTPVYMLIDDSDDEYDEYCVARVQNVGGVQTIHLTATALTLHTEPAHE